MWKQEQYGSRPFDLCVLFAFEHQSLRLTVKQYTVAMVVLKGEQREILRFIMGTVFGCYECWILVAHGLRALMCVCAVTQWTVCVEWDSRVGG